MGISESIELKQSPTEAVCCDVKGYLSKEYIITRSEKCGISGELFTVELYIPRRRLKGVNSKINGCALLQLKLRT